MKFLAKFEPYAYALLRIVAGFLFLAHGLQKLFGVLGGQAVPLASQLGAAGIIEFGGGVLVMIGLWTRLAAIISSGEMAAAYFIAHSPSGMLPIQNRGELAALFCFVFLYIATRGTGPLGVRPGK